MHAPAQRANTFFGWYIVGAMMLILATTGGLAFYNLSVLLDAFVAERRFPVAAASGATAAFFISSGLAGMVAGRLLDRIDARIVIVTSAVLSSLALSATGLVENLWQLYAFHIIFGLAYGGCGLVPAMTILARWFDRKRALALSIAMTGLSLGGAVITPLTAWAIRQVGLAGAGPWLGATFFLGVVPATLLLLYPSPEAKGLTPDGEVQATNRSGVVARAGTPYHEASRSRFFIAVSLAYVFTMAAQVGALAHLFRLATTRNGPEIAAIGVAVLALASIIGRLSGGWILLKVRSRSYTLAWMVFQAAALVALAITHDPVLMLVAIALLGLPVGNLLMMQPLLLAEAFGTRDYGRIYATGQLISVLGVAGGPLIFGLLYDASGGYLIPYLVAGMLGCGGAAILIASGPTPRPPVRE
ncbi:MFS transporter [Chelatococcus reniformis]|nr:MFS transporter [Chelatococcus reniformis]